jgi:CHAT domain-containing protein
MMKNLIIKTGIVAAIVLLNANSASAFGPNRWKKLLDKSERVFTYGDYGKCFDMTARVKNQMLKKGADTNSLFVRAALLESRYLLALKEYFRGEDSLRNAISRFDTMLKSDDPIYRDLLLIISKCYKDNGNLVKALQYAEAAQKVPNPTDPRIGDSGYVSPVILPGAHPDSIFALNVSRHILQIQLERGFFRESEPIIQQNIDYQIGIARKRFPNTDTLAKRKVIKIKRSDLKARKWVLADLYVQRADFYRAKGDNPKASSLYFENQKTLKKLVKSKSYPSLRNVYGNLLLADLDNRLEKPNKDYKKLRKRIVRSREVSVFHEFYNEVAEREIKANLEVGKSNKAKDLFLAYKIDNLNRFGFKSANYLNALKLENEYLNKNARYKRAIKREEKLKKGIGEIIPAENSANIPFNSHFFEFYRLNNRLEEALIELETNEYLAGLNFGEESPAYSVERLRLTNFNLDNETGFADAKVDYETHYDGRLTRQWHEHHPLNLEFLREYSKLKLATDQFTDAYNLSGKALKISNEKFGNNSLEYGIVMQEMAKINIRRGEFSEAESQLDNASVIVRDKAGKKSMEYYVVLMNLAEVYMANGKYDEAQATYKKAFRLLKKSDDKSKELTAGSSEDLAKLYIETGRYKSAEDILDRSLKINEVKYGKDHYKMVLPFSLLGKLFLVTGDYISAESNTRKALNIAEANLGDTSLAYLDNISQLGDIYLEMGNYADAAKIFYRELGLVIKKFGPGNIREADVYQKLAESNFLSPDANLDTIEALIGKSKSIITEKFTSTHPKYGEVLEYEAKAFMLFGKYVEAEANLQSAESIWLDKFGKKHINVAKNQLTLGDLYFYMDNLPAAEKSFTNAALAYKSIFDVNHPGYVSARSRYAKTLVAIGNLTGALKVYDQTTAQYLKFLKDLFPSLSEKEKNRYWNSIKGDFEIYTNLAVKLYPTNPKPLRNVYNFRLATKAVLLSSSTRLKERILNSGDGDLIFRFEQFSSKKELLTKALSMSADERAAAGINIAQLEKEINLLEKELSASSEDFAKEFEQNQYTWKQVKKTLKPGEYAMEIIRYRHFDKAFTDSVLYAFLVLDIKSKKAPKLVVLPNGVELEKKYYKGYRNGIKYKAKDKYSYAQFWKPVDDILMPQSKLYISADGAYNQMNIETLQDEQDAFLIDKYDVVYVSNTKDLVIAQNAEKATFEVSTGLLMGNPSFGSAEADNTSSKVSSTESLPGAEKEIEAVTKLLKDSKWSARSYIQSEATEEELKSAKSPRLLHIATHGFFMQQSEEKLEDLELKGQDIAQNPLLKSGLLLANSDDLIAGNNVYDFNKHEGVLTAYEAMNLNLDFTELVVLSACETGVGEIQAGEGVYGLQRSFLVAGADNVVMTLFKVNDEVTMKLMQTFYTKWIETGNKRTAFAEAKRIVKQSHPEPIFWGSFVMIGLD